MPEAAGREGPHPPETADLVTVLHAGVDRLPGAVAGIWEAPFIHGSIPPHPLAVGNAASHSRKEVVDVDAMSSDACPVRMLSEGEYNVRTSS